MQRTGRLAPWHIRSAIGRCGAPLWLAVVPNPWREAAAKPNELSIRVASRRHTMLG